MQTLHGQIIHEHVTCTVIPLQSWDYCGQGLMNEDAGAGRAL